MPKPKKPPENDILRQVRVRLVEEEERERFDELLKEQHYIHSARLGGQSLRYVAELNGEWVALIAFSAPALNIKARENWIGWTARQRARRLSFVVNNSRFLVLSDRHQYPNLASRVLGLCLKRLNADWQHRWGHPVLVVESFVDESKYRGTCYRACGFQAVGASAGFGRSSRDFYVKHDRPKQLYLRELRKGAVSILRQSRLPAQLSQYEERVSGPCPLRAPQLGSLLDVFKTLEDTRRGHGLRHRQAFVLACAAVAMMMGAGGYQAFEDICGKLTQRQLKALGCAYNRAKKRYCPPSDSTFFRVLNKLEAADFEIKMGRWMMEQEISTLEALAVDGKVLRGSGRGDGKALQLLSAVSHQLRLTVAQEPIQEKSNEIPALKPLLKSLPIQSGLITADALHCQQESSRFITQELGGDYIFGLKGNQTGILERAQIKLPEPFFFPEYDSGWQKEHGRLERRRLQRVATTPEHSGLCGCWQLIAVMRERKELRKGKEVKQSQEYSFYVSSLTCEERSPKQMAQHIRGHWDACENGSHYRRDVTLGEDGSQISGRQRAQVMATLRNLVIGLFELQKSKGKTDAAYLPEWQRKMTATGGLNLIKKGV